jgi:hypothetical protein
MNADVPTQSNAAWFTEQQLAERLQISTRHLINLRKAGLPFIQLGASVRYDTAEVETYLRTNRRLSLHVQRQKRRAALAAKRATNGEAAQ